MSIDKQQNLENDGIDLIVIFRSIWFHKISLLIFITLSVPVSVIYSTSLKPTFKAETVFERPNNRPDNTNAGLDQFGGLGVINFFTGGSISGKGDSFFSEIRSESFLKTVIFNNADFDGQRLNGFCPLPSKETPQLSLRSLLISLGLSENRDPSESQKMSLLVACVNNMIEIGYDTQDSIESSAYRLSIESEDPYFSANLANQIVEKYFARHQRIKEEEFQDIKRYLSKVTAEAQLEFIEANKLIQQFKIENTILMNLKPSSAQNINVAGLGSEILFPASPFAPELNREIANLSQLENSLSQLKEAKLKLSSLKELDQKNTKAFISSIEVQGVLSRAFITSISKIDNLSAGMTFKNQEIKKTVRQELDNLKQQIKALENKIGKKESQTMQLMNIENRFQELAIDVSKKKLIFEGLKDQLKEKILVTGLGNIKGPVLLTKAVPPFSKAFPNKKLIVLLGFALSIFAGIAYILIRQFSLRRVYTLSQLLNISKFLSCYEIKYKQLRLISERSKETAISQSFFSGIKEIGKLGCIIDISQKRLNNNLALEFSKTFASLVVADGSEIVCLNAPPYKKLFSAISQKKFSSGNDDLDARGILSKSVLTFDDEDGMISAGEITKIKNKFLDYDKIICTLGAEIGDLTKFKFIEQCDFYVLIGRSSHFDEYNFKKFSNSVWEKEKKCLGFFMID